MKTKSVASADEDDAAGDPPPVADEPGEPHDDQHGSDRNRNWAPSASQPPKTRRRGSSIFETPCRRSHQWPRTVNGTETSQTRPKPSIASSIPVPMRPGRRLAHEARSRTRVEPSTTNSATVDEQPVDPVEELVVVGLVELARVKNCPPQVEARQVQVRRHARLPEQHAAATDPPRRRASVPSRTRVASCASQSSPTSTVTHALEAVLAAIDARRRMPCGASATSVGYGPRRTSAARSSRRARRRLPRRQPRPRRARQGRHSTSSTDDAEPRRSVDARRAGRAVPVTFSRASAVERWPRARGLFHASARDPVWEYVLGGESALAAFDDRGAARPRRPQPRAVRHRSTATSSAGARPGGTETDLSPAGGSAIRAQSVSRGTATRARPGCSSISTCGRRRSCARCTTSRGRRRDPRSRASGSARRAPRARHLAGRPGLRGGCEARPAAGQHRLAARRLADSADVRR